jgi:hypothetical protein
MAQLRWDRLHQRVDLLEKQYSATITVKPRGGISTMTDSRYTASHTIDGVTFSVKYIYKFINFEYDPKRGVVACASNGMVWVNQPGEVLVMSVMFDNRNDVVELIHTHCRFTVEDNLGNQFPARYSSGYETDTGLLLGTYFPYVPEATSLTIRYEAVNGHEDDCDALIFENVPIDGKEISRSINGETITYNGVHQVEKQSQIFFNSNQPRKVRRVGVTKLVDNLGNQYKARGYKAWGDNRESFGLYSYSSNLDEVSSEATTISFKYLFARTVFAFELRDLPLPS